MEAVNRASQPHACTQADVIKNMDRDLTGWTKWFRRGVGGFLAFVLVYGVIIIWQWFSLSYAVEATDNTVKAMQIDVASIKDKQTEIVNAVVTTNETRRSEQKEQLAAIKVVVENALETKNNKERKR